jgi:drug/metabolite transporter (DMT)-like permease
MEYSLERAILFIALAALTVVSAYLYQRRERMQRVRGVWLWPAIFTVLALHAVLQQLPQDPQVWPWVIIAFLLGIPIGIARAFAFKMRAGTQPGTFHIMATPLSGMLYLAVLIFNEFEHVFRWGDANLARIACGFLVLTAGNSIAVNVTRVVRYRLGMVGPARPQA